MKRRKNRNSQSRNTTTGSENPPSQNTEALTTLGEYLQSVEKHPIRFTPKQLIYSALRVFIFILANCYLPARSWYDSQATQNAAKSGFFLAKAIVVSIMLSACIAIGTIVANYLIIHGLKKPSKTREYLKQTEAFLSQPDKLKVLSAKIKCDIDLTLDRLGTASAFFTSVIIIPIVAFYFSKETDFEGISRLIPLWGAACFATVRLLCMEDIAQLRRWLVLVETLAN